MTATAHKPVSTIQSIGVTLEMIKFTHTIFALPFALLGAVLASEGWPPLTKLVWIVLACVFARSAAMSFNRLHDEPFDRKNPRTKEWPLPAGLLSRKFVVAFCAFNVIAFIVCAGMLNPLALMLSPIALAVLMGYSVTKRFFPGTHFILGLALGIAPCGAWVGIRGDLTLVPIMLGLGVLFWTAGFDLIYSCQDAEFDRKEGLKSIPSLFGKRTALWISRTCHLLCVAVFASLIWLSPLGLFWGIMVGCCGVLLAYEQSLVSANDLSRLGTAFFTINGWVSVLLFTGGLIDIIRF